MGGKNPAIVMPSADLDDAAEGVMKSAFGLQGQKCSACSRIYVHASVKDQFVELLVEKTHAITIGDPSRHGVWLGPVIHERAYKDYESYAELARKDGKVLTGGQTLRTATWRTATSSRRRSSTASRRITTCSGRRCSCRSPASPASRPSTRR